MAKKARRRSHSTGLTVHKPSRMARARHVGGRVARRAGAIVSTKQGQLIGKATALGFGYAQKEGMTAQLAVGGVNPAVVAGLALGVIAPMVLKGKLGRNLEFAGNTLLDIALFKFASGEPLMAGEGFGWGNVAGDGGWGNV